MRKTMRNSLIAPLLAGALIAGAAQAPAHAASPDARGERTAEWTDNLAVPDTANPRELTKRELDGFRTMAEGVVSGDREQAASGLGQAVSVILAVFVSVVVVGQLVELVMRGIRNAGR